MSLFLLWQRMALPLPLFFLLFAASCAYGQQPLPGAPDQAYKLPPTAAPQSPAPPVKPYTPPPVLPAPPPKSYTPPPQAPAPPVPVYSPPPKTATPPVLKPPYPPKAPSPPVVVPPPLAPYPPKSPVTPPVKPPAPYYGSGPPVKKEECVPLCEKRCSLHSRKRLCLRACSTCCLRCKCVPPGTYGNKEVCGRCYTNMTTHGGRPKCP